MNDGLLPIIEKLTFFETEDITFLAVNVIGRFLSDIVGVPVSFAVPFAESQVNVKPKSLRLLIPNLAKSDADTEHVISIGLVPVAEILVSLYALSVFA